MNLAWRKVGEGWALYDIDQDYTMMVLEPTPGDLGWWHVTLPSKPEYTGRMKRTEFPYPAFPEAVPQEEIDRINEEIRGWSREKVEDFRAFIREHGRRRN